MKLAEKIFSIKNVDENKIITIFDIKFVFPDRIKMLEKQLFELNLLVNAKSNYKMKCFSKMKGVAVLDPNPFPINIEPLFPNVKFIPYSERNLLNTNNCFIFGTQYKKTRNEYVKNAIFYNHPIYTVETGFLFSADTFANYKCDEKYRTCLSYVIDSVVPYYDARFASCLEQMINDKNFVITEEQKQRARKCINKIVSTHLTKYNHQPIFEPNIGRKDAKKVLVIDQSYGDMSISKGWGSEETFKKMLQCAIEENPDADIIVKTHPDTMSGHRKGYYAGLKEHDNIYTQTEPINPISLCKYVDKIYVCTTQFGFEALMCGKEVRVFGMPFYAGWGLTQDEQICERRTNKRTLEELFYLSYIKYSHYVHPETKKVIEIEEAMDYLLNLREEYKQIN